METYELVRGIGLSIGNELNVALGRFIYNR